MTWRCWARDASRLAAAGPPICGPPLLQEAADRSGAGGWAVSASLTADVATTAMQRALAVRAPAPGLLHHSDRGVHYACDAYTRVLAAHGITASMSRKGNCWDNAVAESFFSSMQFELELNATWHTAADVERDVGAYIDQFYNPQRLHSHNGFRSPVDFERQVVQDRTT